VIHPPVELLLLELEQDEWLDELVQSLDELVRGAAFKTDPQYLHATSPNLGAAPQLWQLEIAFGA
jgi:hypothetical protein